MSEPHRTPHSEEPAEGQDAGSDSAGSGRTPHAEEPAEGDDVTEDGAATTD